MIDAPMETADAARLGLKALARWDNEGGAGPDGPQKQELSGDITGATPDRSFEHLHARVIALENLVIALLAQGSDAQFDLARDMAFHIAPRPESSHHQLTTRAARKMLALIERSAHLKISARC
jgi:hypothetical protein